VTDPFRLVHDSLSFDTVECLQELLNLAESGDLIGLAYVAMFKGRTYVVDATGEVRRSPTFARGMVSDLHDELKSIRDHTGLPEGR